MVNIDNLANKVMRNDDVSGENLTLYSRQELRDFIIDLELALSNKGSKKKLLELDPESVLYLMKKLDEDLE